MIVAHTPDALAHEFESTFEVPPADAPCVLQQLDARARARAVLGANRWDARSGRRRVYFYLRPESPDGDLVLDRTDRLVFERRDGRIQARLSLKCWRMTDEGARKFHCGDARELSLESCLDMLVRVPTESAMVKHQHRYRLRGRTGTEFKVNFDAMRPLAAQDPSRHGEPFFHLEIESAGGGDPETVMSLLRQEHEVFAPLQPIFTSKKQMAARIVSRPETLSLGSARKLTRYLEEILGPPERT